MARVTLAVVHAQHQCGAVVSVPFADLAARATCPGCGEETWLAERHIAAAREGYSLGMEEVERLEREGGHDHANVFVDVGATGTSRVQ